MKRVLVTGGFGFIGSNLIMKLLSMGYDIVTVDDFSTGHRNFIPKNIAEQINVIEADLSKISINHLIREIKECQTIYHLSANADVKGGWSNTYRDLEQNVIVTYKIAEVARILEVDDVVFTSTGCVYGDTRIIPTPEDHPMPIQTSLYGSSKVASEGILSAYSAQDAFNSTVLRFVSVLGRNYHNGHVIDFVRKLKDNPKELRILGNGNQKKSYIDVSDCVEALIHLRGRGSFEIFNIGQSDFITVKQSAEIISSMLGLEPQFLTEKGERGWIGDNPFTFLDVSKAKSQGWTPKVEIKQAIESTVDWIAENNWILTKENLRAETRLP